MGVMMISRHRQWRSWQFGVRHSGLWKNSGSSSGSSNGGDPEWFQQLVWWKKLLVILGMSAVLLILFYWFPGLFILLAIIGWLSILFGK